MIELTFAYDLVEDSAADLDVSRDVVVRAQNIAGRADISGRPAKSPQGIAAGALYLAALLENEKVTQGEVADAADVSIPTIRDNYLELLEVDDRLPDAPEPDAARVAPGESAGSSLVQSFTTWLRGGETDA